MKLKINRVVRGWEFADKITPNFENMTQNPVSFGRKFSMQSVAPYWEEAFGAFGLKPSCVEPMFLNMTGCHYIDGAHVQVHKDDAPYGFVHTRCNVMITKPKVGGNPVLDEEEILVDEGDMWLCLASLEWHSSTPIFDGGRVIFSFGGLVPMEQINSIIDHDLKTELV